MALPGFGFPAIVPREIALTVESTALATACLNSSSRQARWTTQDRLDFLETHDVCRAAVAGKVGATKTLQAERSVAITVETANLVKLLVPAPRQARRMDLPRSRWRKDGPSEAEQRLHGEVPPARHSDARSLRAQGYVLLTVYSPHPARRESGLRCKQALGSARLKGTTLRLTAKHSGTPRSCSGSLVPANSPRRAKMGQLELLLSPLGAILSLNERPIWAKGLSPSSVSP